MNNLDDLRRNELIQKAKKRIEIGVKDMMFHTREGTDAEFEVNLKAGLKSLENNLKRIRQLRNE